MSGTPDLDDACDVAVVGAGPAGLAAATVCAGAGLRTVLFDEQAAPGGQIYRGITETPVRRGRVFGKDYWAGEALVDAFRSSGAHHVPGATVWSLSAQREIGVSVSGSARFVTARRVILATGALERPFPIPGWTLPGVMTAGAAQILLKTAGLAASRGTVLAGSGPLLWLLAAQYLEAGVRLDAILDTTARASRGAALPHALAFLASPYLAKGLRLLRKVRAGVRVFSNVTALRAEGGAKIERVVYRVGGGAEATLPAETLLLHQGVVPNVNLAMAACKASVAGVGAPWRRWRMPSSSAIPARVGG
jgi:NADPH-dependent 2,4-dienoyl-CoA reductase/sulfur reductase-like enzyme